MLGRRVVRPIDTASQRIILKIDIFLVDSSGGIHPILTSLQSVHNVFVFSEEAGSGAVAKLK